MNTETVQTIDPISLSDEQIFNLEQMAAVVEPLCEGGLGVDRRRELRTQACVTLNIGERTLRSLVSQFKSGGLLALLRKKRKDAGLLRKFDPALIPKAAALLQENPNRSAARLLEFLRHDPLLGPAAHNISASCLYHRLKEAGVDFRELRASLPKRTFISFEANHPNQLWQGDARHGIPLPNPDQPGKSKMTYLFAWIDDYSRLILHAQYYWDEKLPRLEDSFRQAVLKHGLPDKIYVDNGAAYRAHQLLLILDRFKVSKVHHPPYRAWCKGKVESLMKALKKFQAEAALAGMKTLDELNSALAAWIDIEHNHKIHSQTGEVPLERFLAGIEKRSPRRITDLEAFNAAFLWQVKRTVSALGEISVETNRYPVVGIPPATSVKVRYNPFDLSRVYLFENEACTRILVPRIISRRQASSLTEEQKNPNPKVSRAAEAYFTRLREQNLKNIAEGKPINAYSNLKNKGNTP